MQILMALLRLIHILSGVVWGGTAFFFVLFLTPTLQMAGPEGGKFMQRLAQTGLAGKLSIASALVVVSGLIMYWVASGGLVLKWISSTVGIALTIGSLAGIIAFGIGLAVQAPANARLAAIQKEIQSAGGPPSAKQMAEVGSIQKTISNGALWGAVLMAIALIGMVIAQ